MRYGCQQCREEVPARHADELSHLARARLAAHLDACSSCRSYASRYAAAIESARAWPPTLTAARKEAILDRISARGEPMRVRQAPRWHLAALSLPIAAAALVVFALARSGTEVATSHSAAGDARRERSAPLAVGGTRAGEAREAPPGRIGPAPGHEIDPHAAGPATQTEVRGPVVARGSRRVGRPVEPAAHAVRGSSRSAVAEAGTPSMPAEDSPERLHARSPYTDAERAMAEGRPAAAARILEELIERSPETAEAQVARLELGRLYAGPLGYPARAVLHLSAFVSREPEPGARRAARGLLCQLLPAAERDRVCWPGLASLGKQE